MFCRKECPLAHDSSVFSGALETREIGEVEQDVERDSSVLLPVREKGETVLDGERETVLPGERDSSLSPVREKGVTVLDDANGDFPTLPVLEDGEIVLDGERYTASLPVREKGETVLDGERENR